MRKKRKLIRMLPLAVLLSVSLFSMISFAGASYTVIDNTTFREKISNGDWNNPEGDVFSENNQLVFPKSSTKDTRLITKVGAKKTEWLGDVYQAQFQMKIVNLPSKEEFILASGLAGIESEAGQKGNVELVFTNNSGISVSLRAYAAHKNATQLTAAKRISAQAGNGIQVETTLSAEQEYTVTVNGTQIYNGKIPVSGEGRFGFLQTGNCHVVVSDVMLKLYSYDKPENCNIEEHFDGGAYDKALLTNKMLFTYKYYPTSISVVEYNGNDVLMFQNAANSYLGTRYPYSNFEMTFDVPYVQRAEVLAEDGKVKIPRNPWIGVSFGDEAMEQPLYGYENASDMILFYKGSEIRSMKPETKVLADLSGTDHAFYAENETRGFSVKIKMVDAHMEIGIKWMDEESFTTAVSYDLEYGNTPNGYIHIWALEVANFAIDNLMIKNLDQEPNLVETKRISSKVIVPADYAYKKSDLVYDPGKGKGEQRWYLMIPCAAAAAVLCVAIPVIMTKARKKRGQSSNEE